MGRTNQISHIRTKLLSLLVLFLNLNSLVNDCSGQSQNELANRMFCTDQWCEDAQVTCSEIVPNCTRIGFRTMLSPERCNCCDYCFDYLEEGADCPTEAISPPAHMCGPSLQCTKSADEDGLVLEKCEIMKRTDTSCNSELVAYNASIESGTLGVAQYKPECDAHGNYLPRQCLTGSICYCANDNGERIFGSGTVGSRMNCACARDYDRIRSFGLEGSWPHCLPNGNYDELQCSKRTRTCYCVSKPQTGVPIQMWTTLPCYDRAIHGTSYLKPCELRVAEITIQTTEAEMINKTLLYADIPRCDPDGNYQSIQSENSKWICVDAYGNQLVDDEANDTPFEVEKNGLTPGDMNCNCARARYIISNSSTKPKCCPNGSYRKWQCSGSTCYCVDSGTGKQNMAANPPEVHIDEVQKLECYKDEC